MNRIAVPSVRRLLSRRRFTWSAALAFTFLSLGGVAHVVHHIVDRDCDRGPAPVSHPCASCAGLHVGAMVEKIQTAIPQARLWTRLETPRLVAPAFHATQTTCVPRAPPVVL